MTTPPPLRYLLGAVLIATAMLVVLQLAGFRVSVWPWMLFAFLAGAIWWVLAGESPRTSETRWEPPRPDPPPMRYTADLRTRRTVTMIADAHPAKGFTAVALTRTLADRARSRLVRRHGLPASETFAHAGHLLSPQLLDYLRRSEGPEDTTRTVSPRTLRVYLKEIEAL